MDQKPLADQLEEQIDDDLLDEFELVDITTSQPKDNALVLEEVANDADDDWIEIDDVISPDGEIDLTKYQQKQDKLSQAIDGFREKLGLKPKAASTEPVLANLDDPLLIPASESSENSQKAHLQRLAEEMSLLKRKFAEISRQRALLTDEEIESMLRKSPQVDANHSVKPPSLLEDEDDNDDDSPPLRRNKPSAEQFIIAERPEEPVSSSINSD